MSAARGRTSLSILAACVAASAMAATLRAEESRRPLATVPVPPPEPPARPENLGNGAVATESTGVPPVPPSRPAELTAQTAPPLPPPRPTTLRVEPGSALPTADVPAPPARPSELNGPPVLSLSVVPSELPLPPQRPADMAPAGSMPTTSVPAQADAPPPPPRPAELSGAAADAAILEAPKDEACLKRLDATGVSYTKRLSILNGQCSVAHPLELRSIAPSDSKSSIALTADQTVVCGVAEALGLWSKDVLAAAEKELGDRLTGLTLGGGYVCRGQNHVGEAKLSEHAFANAIDVMGFTFAKHAPITVGFLPENSAEAKFLDSVRASACGHFRTVLGPGSNDSHADHLHFDQRERPGGHRLCELRPSEPDSKQSANAKP